MKRTKRERRRGRCKRETFPDSITLIFLFQPQTG